MRDEFESGTEHSVQARDSSIVPIRAGAVAWLHRHVHNGCCQGWALDTKSASPVDVELFVDGQLVERARADVHRDDLEREGLGDGRHGFAIEMPAALRDGRHHRVETRSRDGRIVAAREAMQIVPKLTPAEFDC